LLQQISRNSLENKKWVQKFSIGKGVQGTVDQVLPYGVSVILGSKVNGLLCEEKLEKGEKVSCQVVDIDTNLRIVDLRSFTAKVEPETLLENAKKAMDKEVDAVVEVVKEDYAIVCIDKLDGVVGFLMNRAINSTQSPVSRFKVGDKIKVTISRIDSFEPEVYRVFVSPKKVTIPTQSLDLKRGLKNPIDSEYQSLDDLLPGTVVKCQIVSVKETQINMKLSDNLRGRIHSCQIFDNFGSINDLKNPLGEFEVKKEIECKVIGFHSIKTHMMLPISHKNSISQVAVELSIKPSVMKGAIEKVLEFEDVNVGKEYVGYVSSIERNCLWVQISQSLSGRIDSVVVNEDLQKSQNLEKVFKLGQALKCRLLSKDSGKKECNFSLIQKNDLKVDMEVVGRITKVDQSGLTVFIGNRYGKINITEINEEMQSNPLQKFKVGELLKSRIMAIDGKKCDLSLLKTRKEFKTGDICQGYINNVSDKGCYVSLSFDKTARIKIAEISDEYVKEWKTLVKVGQLVKGAIKSINSSNQIEMSLKKSETTPGKRIQIQDLKPKMVVPGTVRKIEKFGVFISLDDSLLSGLCHISEVAENPVKDVGLLYEVGDRVQAYVLRVDTEKGKVSLSLKASYFADLDESDSMDVDGSEDVAEMDSEDSENAEVDSDKGEDAEVAFQSDDECEEIPTRVMDSEEAENNESDVTEESDDEVQKEPLILQGFSWDSNLVPAEEPDFSTDSESEPEKDDPKKTRRSIKKQKEDEENIISAKEKSLLDTDVEPETSEDFERMLLGTPNSSFLWIKYMALQLELAEADKARMIADRALETINYREEQERLNVLIALLNLENQFGNKATFKQTFDKACQMSDPKKVYMQTTQIYERSENFSEAENLYKKMCKKFNTSSKVWLSYAQFLIIQSKNSESSLLIEKSLKSLPTRKRIK
jgi:rRNA biogenesis protein RRP5